MSSDTTAVRIDHVTKEFGDVVAVDDVSLDIQEGEFLTILGPSGAGKTSLLHMVAGFVEPTHGTIAIDGEDVTADPPYERDIGMVFQGMALFPHMTVGENIAFPLEMRRYDPDQIDERVQEMLDLIRLPEIADRDVDELSGGQQQRVAIARGLAFEPSLLLLDEPLSSLDKKLREEMRTELLRIHREADVTTVHVTHNQEEALTMADRIAVIRDGQIVQHASTHDIYDHPNSAFIADFIGNTNILEGNVLEQTDDGCVVSLGESGPSIECRSETAVEPNAPVTLGVRYERIEIGETLATDNVYAATVVDLEFSGDTITYDVEFEETGHHLSVTELNTTDTHVFRREDTVCVGWNSTDAFVYPEA